MAGSTTGILFRLTSFGESHGTAIGGVIDGCPAGLEIDLDFIRQEMEKRKTARSSFGSPRKERDEVDFLSGIFEHKTTGAPIAFIIRNKDQRPKDYGHLRNTYRPSHADYTYEKKYGHRDFRGGGRSSARETAIRVAAGAIAKLFLKHHKISVKAFVSEIGPVRLNKSYTDLNLTSIEDSTVRCPDKKISADMEEHLDAIKKKGDTAGGVITCVVSGLPAGIGEPVFDKLDAELAKAILSINAVKGFDIGSGFRSAAMKGSEHNDRFTIKNGIVSTESNHSGGVQGGISNGQDLYFRAAFKPVATLMSDQKSIDKQGKEVIIEGKGRHDVCVVPRAVPIVEAMTSLTIADAYLRNRNAKL